MKASGRRVPLRIIGAFKLAKGVLLVTVALGALHLVHRDIAEVVFRFVRRLHLDPEGRQVNAATAGSWVTRSATRRTTIITWAKWR
jgi:hypothetical protein